ncbi:MAG: hypothetical protein KJ893_09960 [Candidatus Omnitrophica bacterium]|nr:hypothetical protein [Candidatus Omnitrophota bacterium]MBU4478144.1 hypothetical protein [Candidatus Omnitrophota bacterium]MCG2704059.1 hypothetical protein [Candidatus Omnitrophota bacterium]
MDTGYVSLLKDQISLANIPEKNISNILAVMNYENSVLAVTKNLSEILFAYPQEEDPGIYVVAVNGRIVAANNRRAVSRYLDTLRMESDLEIMVHKLGSILDMAMHRRIRQQYVLA